MEIEATSLYGCKTNGPVIINHTESCITNMKEGEHHIFMVGRCTHTMKMIGTEIWFNHDSWERYKDRIDTSVDKIKMIEMWLEMNDGYQKKIAELEKRIIELEKK